MNDRLHRVVGIDLGTTYSAVAAYDTFADSAEIIYDPVQGKPHGAATPSVVWLNSDRKVVVGAEAKRAIASDPIAFAFAVAAVVALGLGAFVFRSVDDRIAVEL
jgi:molecular chaperone DnaK (HSP70)